MAEPYIAEDARPSRFLEAVGRRSALLGREDGTFEAWINPLKVLRDFQLSAYFDGSLEPVPVAGLAERVHVSPGRSTIVHSHAAFTIRQHWIAPLDQPALIVLLDIDCDRPLKLRASFVPEMKPMWPASFGGQSSTYIEGEHLFALGEGTRRHAAVIGSPAFTRSSEQVGHQLPDRTVLVEMDITPEVARTRLVPVIIAASGQGPADARRIYREVLAQLPAIVRASDEYYRQFGGRMFRVETPVHELNRAFEWARFAIEKGWACSDGVGCGLVAGYGPSGASERPGFAWYFGGDALMNSWSIVDYGDFARARGVLEFLRDHQRSDGKMMHELTQSAALLDWNKYPYGYFHGDTTPLFLFSAAEYVERSGDLEFLKTSWPAIERAYRFCLGTLDEDGLMSGRRAGTAAVETGALSGRVEKDIYLEGAWLAGLDGYRRMAETGGHAAEAREAASRLELARKSLESWYGSGKGWFPFGRLTDGSLYDAQSSWQAFALAYGGLDPGVAKPAAASLSRPALSTPWGTRLFATDSPYYDPLGYNDGSVWPFVTGFVIAAEFRNGAPASGLRHLYGLAALTGLSGAGFIPENMSGDRMQTLPRAVPHQLFSSSAVIRGVVSGLLGLEGNALTRTLRMTPRVPAEWPRVRFENYRIGDSVVSGEITNTRVRLTVAGPPLDITVAGSHVPRTNSVDVSYHAPAGAPVELQRAEVGDRAP